MTDYEKALSKINEACRNGQYDKYEKLIEETSNRFNKAIWIVEDDVIDRYFEEKNSRVNDYRAVIYDSSGCTEIEEISFKADSFTTVHNQVTDYLEKSGGIEADIYIVNGNGALYLDTVYR